MTDQWVGEEQTPHRKLLFKVKEIICDEQSDFQRVQIIDTYDYGRLLLLDGCVMSNERDEFIYHEMLSCLGLARVKSAPNVLIIGGGDGGTAREVLKDPNAQVTMAEIDGMVIEKSRKFLSYGKALSDPRLTIHVTDGIDFLRKSKQKYDLILVDGADPVGPAKVLFEKEFLSLLRDTLTDDGVAVTQSESLTDHLDFLKEFYPLAKSIFPKCSLHSATIPTYPGALWSFTVMAKKSNPVRELSGDYFYYSLKIDEASQVIPKAFDPRT